MTVILLIRGGEVLLDDEDAPRMATRSWHTNATGYAVHNYWVAGADGTKRSLTDVMHREILGLATGDRRIADHLNRNRLDNRRENLAIVDLVANAQNRGASTGSRYGQRTSRYRGVSKVLAGKHAGRWAAQVGSTAGHKWLGHFATEREAAEAAALERRARGFHGEDRADVAGQLIIDDPWVELAHLRARLRDLGLCPGCAVPRTPDHICAPR